MLTTSQLEAVKKRTHDMLQNVGITLTNKEIQNIEAADLGLDHLESEGLQLIVYENNDRYCAKELILFPNQTCPEHKHPPVGNDPGKRETFRCRWGKVLLYVEGEPTKPIRGKLPAGSENYYTAMHEIELSPGEQYTIAPDTFHWFQAEDQGAIISEFSSTSRDELDIFTDPRIKRATEILDD